MTDLVPLNEHGEGVLEGVIYTQVFHEGKSMVS
jgi:hypothetical protein